MKKITLKSVAVLSLAVTAFGMAQPASAVTNYYEDEVKTLTSQMESLNYGHHVGGYFEQKKTEIDFLLGLGGYLFSKEEFSHPAYKTSVEENYFKSP